MMYRELGQARILKRRALSRKVTLPNKENGLLVPLRKPVSVSSRDATEGDEETINRRIKRLFRVPADEEADRDPSFIQPVSSYQRIRL